MFNNNAVYMCVHNTFYFQHESSFFSALFYSPVLTVHCHVHAAVNEDAIVVTRAVVGRYALAIMPEYK